MGKIAYSLLVCGLVFLGVFFLSKKNSNNTVQPRSITLGSQPQVQTRAVQPDAMLTNGVSVAEVLTETNGAALFDVVTATNLSQWQASIPKLRLLNPSEFEESWILEIHDSSKYLQVRLTGVRGQSFSYITQFIDIEVKTNDYVRRVELHAPNMHIEEIRALGSELNNLFGIEPQSFLAWCNTVGNRSMDQPVFASKDGVSPNPNKNIGYTINHTFNDEKPWYVTFIYSDN